MKKAEYKPINYSPRTPFFSKASSSIQRQETGEPPMGPSKLPGEPSPPASTGSLTFRRRGGRWEFSLGGPKLPAIGSPGAGVRWGGGQSPELIFGPNPFEKLGKDMYSFGDLRNKFGKGSSNSPTLGPFPNIGQSPTLGNGCLPGSRPNNLGICIRDYPFLRENEGEDQQSTGADLMTQRLSLGNLNSTTVPQFAQNQSTLPANAEVQLSTLVPQINDLPSGGLVHIDGHASSEGNPRRNEELSVQRAEAVKKKLIELGVTDPSRFVIEGKGSSQPAISDDETEQSRTQNRRVEIWFFTDNPFQLPMRSILQAP